MTTIPRNATRKIAALKQELTSCRVFRLDNDFHGQPVDPQFAWEALERFSFAKLTEVSGKYSVNVHGNYWYELTPSRMVQGYLISGTIHVHKAGCADIARARLPQKSDSAGTPEEATSELMLVESWYADMIDEHPEFNGYMDDPEMARKVVDYFISEFHIYPCVNWLCRHYEAVTPALNIPKRT